MAVPAILDLPADATEQLERVGFHPPPVGQLSQSASGEVSFQEKVGGNLWRASWVTRGLNNRNFGIYHGFFLNALTRKFRGFDLRRCQPIAYTEESLAALDGGYDGSVTVAAAGGNTVDLEDLPPGLILTTGDYISFPWRDTQELVYVSEPVVASGGGVISGLTIHPWLIAGGTVPAAGTIVRAWCYMRMIPDSWSGSDRSVGDPVSFQSIQDKTPNA